MLKKILLYGGIAIIVLAILIQFIPYGRNHTNPAVVKQPTWDNQQTQALFERACGDCHSNNTNWLWYSNIAPFSWLIQRDVIEGRSRLNLSECGVVRPGREGGEGVEGGEGREGGGEAGEMVLSGEMPPIQYTLIHPEARLTTAERQALAQGLANSPCK
jgi:hypothetical protein